MPRIDPLQLLNCLQVLLSPNGGILSKEEVHRLASLMTKFSKKLVSKCIYVLILKNTDQTLLGAFMTAGGWTLIQLWLHDAMCNMNWALVKELLELILITPVDVERLKSNNIPKLVKTLSKRGDLQGVHELSNQLVQQWLKIVKNETHVEQPKLVQTVTNTVIQPMEIPVVDQSTENAIILNEQESEHVVNAATVYKLTLKDGKHLISKVGNTFEFVDNVEIIEMKEEEEEQPKEKLKEKKDDKKRSSDKNRHKSSSSSKSSSGSKDKDRNNSHKSKSKHGSSGSSSSGSSSKDKEKSGDRDRHDKKKDKHRSNGSIKSSSRSSSSKEKEEKDPKERQAEKDKDTLAKLQPQSLLKLPKIPKRAPEDKEKNSDSKTGKKEEPKKGTMSVEVRKNNEERPKTVKVYKSKMRSTGLEEEAKPAPPRPAKKPATSVSALPPPVSPSMKRSSPIRDLATSVPPEKKSKIEATVDRPGAIKLIPPKPKRISSLHLHMVYWENVFSIIVF